MSSSLIPGIPSRLVPGIMSYNEMLPGLLETPANKQRLLDEMKSCRGEHTFARKDLPEGRYCYVSIVVYKRVKRPRHGPRTETWRFIVRTEVRLTRQPFDKLEGVIYQAEIDDDKDMLWTGVSEALKIQTATPGNLCVHCRGRLTWVGTDTCPRCTFGLPRRTPKPKRCTASPRSVRRTARPRGRVRGAQVGAAVRSVRDGEESGGENRARGA